MVVWAKLANPRAKVYHAWDLRWAYQRTYNSLCGMWRKHYELGGFKMTRKCKTCKRMQGYHLKRPPPVWLRVRINLGPKNSGRRFLPHG